MYARLRPWLVLLVVLVAVLVGGSASEPSADAKAKAKTSTQPQNRMYWGAWIGSQLTGSAAPWDASAISAFERVAGKGVSLVNFSSPFADCTVSPCKPYTFPGAEFTKLRDRGSIPFFSWNSGARPVVKNQPDHQLSDIVEGRHDAYLTKWATSAKAWGKPFFLRFDWEMNGTWFPWSEGVNGNRRGEYVAAWRHVHDLFARVGATNATWVWCPNVDPTGIYTPLAGLYPGDSYVDWTCLDGYNWGSPWRSFSEVFKSTYDEITRTIAPSKPMLIGETATTEKGGSKARWIADMFRALPTEFPRVRGLLWFENLAADGLDWPVETSLTAQTAFQTGIGDRRFAANEFAALTTSPIPPPAGP
jgi:hypothetical protein